MECINMPQHIETQLDDLKFSSNFDSGNLLRVVKSGPTSYELYIAADAQNRGFNHYRTWFHFAIQGLKKKTFIKLSIMNLSHLRVFASPHYRPVFKSLPSSPDWKQIPGDCTYNHNFANFYKISWIFSSDFDAQTVYFAFAAPYTLSEITQSIDIFEQIVPARTYFHREVLIKSPDRRNVELITIGHETCFSKEREPKLPNLFPNSKLRPLKSKVPVVVITSRVHPGETPASYLLEAILRAILQPSKLMEALRRQCVFKIIPCLNPDGVFRGHYRADQFGVNLNRCYISPTYIDHPTIYATKNYIEYLHFTDNQLWMYLDLHAHISKRGCFLFGNALDSVRQIENQLIAKILSLNSTYVDYGECDFSEKSMMRKDPKDPISKEGSGRVAIYRSTNIIHSYTIECCYHCPRSLHNISNLVNLKTGKRVAESLVSPDLDFAPMVYNKLMYEEIGIVRDI